MLTQHVSPTFSVVLLNQSPETYSILDDYTPYFRQYYKCSVSTSSEQNRRLAKSWLQHCMKAHERCRLDTIQSGGLPTRLLEIKYTNYTPTVRVIETRGQSLERSSYIALSYCWGKAIFPTLRIDNEKQCKDGVPFLTLPRTIQDAIWIAGWFRVQYLWIDSLCILQDSQADWARESYKMRSVYKNSTLTIAATGAIDPSIGCFRNRRPELIEPIKVRALDGTTNYKIAFSVDMWTNAIHGSPLSKRAWAFQERMLSPRVLHFGESQMLWECNEMDACETCPGGIDEHRSDGPEPAIEVARKRLPRRADLDFLGQVWRPLVQSYTRGALTRFSDKPVAISGIADEAHSYGRTYAAGLWREDIERQLLWQVSHHRKDSPHSCTRPAYTYVAPSWSWLSVDGEIRLFTSGTEQVLHLEVIELELEMLSINHFGPFKSGYIRARGTLVPATWQIISDEEHPFPHWQLRSIRGRLCESIGLVRRVLMDSVTETEHKVFCVPVWSTSTYVGGLLLASTGAMPHEYRRAGTFSFNIFQEKDRPSFRRFFQRRLKSRRWTPLRKQIFTIV